MNEEVRVHVSEMDVYAGLIQTARIAFQDRMPSTGERCVGYAVAIQNACNWARDHCPEGYMITTEVVFTIKPSVNQVFGLNDVMRAVEKEAAERG
jgi:hypothetical protein